MNPTLPMREPKQAASTCMHTIDRVYTAFVAELPTRRYYCSASCLRDMFYTIIFNKYVLRNHPIRSIHKHSRAANTHHDPLV